MKRALARPRLLAVLLLPVITSCGGRSPVAPPPTPSLASTTTQAIARNGYTLVVTNLDPAFPQSVLDEMTDCFFTVYPVMAARFNPGARRSVTLTLDPSRSGVAATGGGVITVASAYVKAHPTDIDLVTHEAFHVVQAYTGGGRPSWAVEGLADYARDRYGVSNARGGWSLPSFSASQKYTDSYRVTARFFRWLEARVKPTVLDALDAGLRAAPYREAFWVEQTGKSVDQLWADYAAAPALP